MLAIKKPPALLVSISGTSPIPTRAWGFQVMPLRCRCLAAVNRGWLLTLKDCFDSATALRRMGNLPKYDCVSQTDSIFREIVREESAEELCQYGLFEADQMPAAATESMVLYLCIRITGDVLAARMNDISHAQADANKAGVRLTFFFAMMGLRGCRIGLCSGEAAARAAVVAAKPNGSFDETKFSSWYAYEMASTGMLPSVVSANCGSKLRGATLNPLAGIIE